MKRVFLAVMFTFLFAFNAHASGLLGTYYNLPNTHLDMETAGIFLSTGLVANSLSGDMPTLTAKGLSEIHQWDWWTDQYKVFQRVDSTADLQNNFTTSWFPVNTGLAGDPQDFAVKWSGKFYVATAQNYNYSMGSDDDSWLFIDKQLVLDLGGVHGMSYINYTVNLTPGYHDIDIFFAERHVVDSGFRLNFFSDLEPTAVPEPAGLLLLGMGLIGLLGLRKK